MNIIDIIMIIMCIILILSLISCTTYKIIDGTLNQQNIQPNNKILQENNITYNQKTSQNNNKFSQESVSQESSQKILQESTWYDLPLCGDNNVDNIMDEYSKIATNVSF
jgi:Tfp pilus assembly protein PilE